MDGKEFLESRQIKNITLETRGKIGTVDLASLLDLYMAEQGVNNKSLETAKIEATKRIKMAVDSALYEYHTALSNGRCGECKDPLAKGEKDICEDCLCSDQD